MRKAKAVQWEKLLHKEGSAVVQIFVVKEAVNWLAPHLPPRHFQISGTGWFIDNSYVKESNPSELLIVTNAHVAKDAASMYIRHTALNKEPIDVEVVGICSQRDIALLRVSNPGDLTTLVEEHGGKIHKMTLGNSDTMQPGDEVSALGFPLGFNGLKITMGVVSGYQVFEHALYAEVDAAINPGNSGGPLLNSAGKVLGINSAKMQGADNMSFAIPAKVLLALINSLYGTREFRLPFLGVKFNNANKDMRAQLKMNALAKTHPGGVYIKKVDKNGIFSNAGVQAGDFLLMVDKHKMDRFGQFEVPEMKTSLNLFGLVARKRAGSTIKFTVWRNHKLTQLSTKYDVTPLDKIHLVQEVTLEKPKFETAAGIVFSPLTLNLAMALLKVNANFDGIYPYIKQENRNQDVVVVVSVSPGSAASRSGTAVQVGQVVTKVNGKKITTLGSLCSQISKSSKFLTLEGNHGNFAAFSRETMASEVVTDVYKDTKCQGR